MSDTVIVALLGFIGTLFGSLIGLFGSSVIESKRTKNKRNLHSQQIHFDYEFNLYQALSEKHLIMVYDIGAAAVISREGKHPNIDTNKDFLCIIAQHIDDADIQNKRSAPFISKDIFEAYKKLGELSRNAMLIFELYCKFEEYTGSIINYSGKQYTRNEALKELENLQIEISVMSDNILDQVRIYINKKINN